MSKRLEGRVSLITGGTSGIGEAAVRLFSEEGSKVVFTGRRTSLGFKLQEELGFDNVRFFKCDHTISSDCRRSVEYCISQFGSVDILFNNAGIVQFGDAEELSEEDWAYCFKLNVTAVWLMMKYALPFLRNSKLGGAIVNNASDWGLVGGESAAAYCSSKAAVVNLSRAVALDNAQRRVRVNVVCPGDTFVRRWIERDRDQVVEPSEDVSDAEVERRLRTSSTIPLGRTGDAIEVAKAALFLASHDASFITGTTLAVDGGNTAS